MTALSEAILAEVTAGSALSTTATPGSRGSAHALGTAREAKTEAEECDEARQRAGPGDYPGPDQNAEQSPGLRMRQGHAPF